MFSILSKSYYLIASLHSLMNCCSTSLNFWLHPFLPSPHLITFYVTKLANLFWYGIGGMAEMEFPMFSLDMTFLILFKHLSPFLVQFQS